MLVRRLGAACLVVIATLLAGCSAAPGGAAGPTTPQAQPATVVTVSTAAKAPISQEISYTGTTQAADSVNIAPTISGRITKLNVDVGGQVKAGDPIAELDKSTLSAQVEQAQAGVSAANAKLAQVQSGARPEAVAVANANVVTAQAKLDALKGGGRSEAVAQAKSNVDIAKAKLATIQAGARPENAAQAKANLDAAQSKLQALLNGPTPDQVAAAKLQVEQAKNTLYSVQTTKDGQCNPRNPAFQCQAAQAQANAAETGVTVAEQNLKTLTDPPTQEAVNQAKSAVDAAQQAYQLAQHPYTAQDIAQAQAAVDSAQQAYQLAQNPATAQDIKQAQAAVDAANNQAKLAAQPYTDSDTKAAQAAVDQAKAALDAANAQLGQATIVAPFSGVIAAKLLSAGSLASPSTPIVTLMSPDLQVQFSIDEARIASIKPGQTVSLTSSAFPGRTFPATIASIYPSADPKTHAFTVVAKQDNNGGDLRPGMFLTLTVTVAASQDAIVVPSVAIVQKGNQSVVYTVVNDRAHMATVTTGISAGDNTQIISGLNAGDQVITSNQANLIEGSPVRAATQNQGRPGNQTPTGRPAAPAKAPQGQGSGSDGSSSTPAPAATPAG